VSEPIEVLYLAGQIGFDAEGKPLASRLDRLERRGILARVICLSRGSEVGADARFVEAPALGRRWLRGVATRQLRQEFRLEHPCLLHVLHESMAETAIAMADVWQIPYLQELDEFGVVDRGLRISRHWFRGLIVPLADLADQLVADLGLPADQIQVIPPGLDPEPIVRNPDSSKIPVIGAVGQLREGSGFLCLLEAARQVLDSGRDVEFLLATQGQGAIDLRRFARSLGVTDRVSVVDYGAVGTRFWSVLDLYCQPSLVPSTGRALSQALSRGVPSIATHVPGLRSLIDPNRSGLIVPPGNAEALALAILQLLDDPQKAAAMGRHAREALRNRLDAEHETELLAALYRRHAMAISKEEDEPS
jgi:glycosyltransferase involved in cell wall biosynthesis